jgi:hypothetical protein
MPAQQVFHFFYIAPGGSASLFVHGFPTNWASVFSVTPYALEGEAYFPLGKVALTQEVVLDHVDGTIGRVAEVQNLAPFNPCAVDLNVLYDSV